METAEAFDDRARWYHGLYGGLAGGVVALAFFWIVGAAWLRDIPVSEIARLDASTILGTHAHEPSALVVAVGIAIHFITAAVCGIVYALLARRLPGLTRAPVSAISGLVYGAIVWYVLANVVVPLTHAPNIVPMWEGLVASMLGFGFAVSEVVTALRPKLAVPG
jgi:uncharacterized membrane protein HdeD (DUF308 family)